MKNFNIYKDAEGNLNFDGIGTHCYTLSCSSESMAQSHLAELQRSHDLVNKPEPKKRRGSRKTEE